jgi:hypothetical protein
MTAARQERSLEWNLEILLNEFCTEEGGFCSVPSIEKIAISKSQHLDARGFAVRVLGAEGFEAPESERELMRRIQARFVEFFGAVTVQAEDYPEARILTPGS